MKLALFYLFIFFDAVAWHSVPTTIKQEAAVAYWLPGGGYFLAASYHGTGDVRRSAK